MDKCNGDYLSYENTKCLKGISALFIILHHLYQNSLILKNTIFGSVFQEMGEWFVSIFFFCSGYGLMVSYNKKGKDYINKFIKNRILPFYIIYILLIIAYTVLYIVMGETKEISLNIIMKSFIFGGSIVRYGWYLQAILFFYWIFYLIFRFSRNDKERIVGLIVGYITYCILCNLLNLTITWYISSISFLLGTLWCKYKSNIDLFLSNKKRIYISLIIYVILFVIIFILEKIILSENLFILIHMIANVMFVLIILNILKIGFNIKNVLTEKIGNISFEIYVLQGIFILLYHSSVIFINNPWKYVIVTFISTIIFAYTLHPLFNKINMHFKNK